VQGLAGNDAGLQGPYQVRHLCELIHAESAKPLATYRDDFYAGRPAVTVNQFGKGKAWHVASRNDLAFQRDFFASLIDELALPRAVEQDFPPGLWQRRVPTGKARLFLFRTLAPSSRRSPCRRAIRIVCPPRRSVVRWC
jgi:beta-galactosidase GanA